jgi:outer membrane protein TolC
MNQTYRQLAAALLSAAPALAQAPPAGSGFAADRLPPAPDRPVVRGVSADLPTVLPRVELAAPKADVKDANTLPIDLPTALRLANASNPTIAIAQVRVLEALARVDAADALKLPTVSAGGIYTRHDGLDQNRRADLFRVSRGSVFAGGGVSVRVDLAEAYFQPLVARRLADAEAAAARAAANNTQFDVVSAYFDLVQAHALLEINADILARAEEILRAARAGERQGIIKTAADVNRAETEVSLRKLERQELAARAAVASANLVRLLALDPAVVLVPADPAAVPIDLIPTDTPVRALIEQAVRERPELRAAALQVDAADARARQARLSPLLPKVQADYLGGGFGGGTNGSISNPEGRGDLTAQVFWELRGLGFGTAADIRLREAERDRAVLTAVAAKAQVGAEVSGALRAARARQAGIEDARNAAREAQEMFRKLSATSFGMIGPRGQFDALEPLSAVQSLSQSRLQLLAATVEYNRAQYRLFTAVGQPASVAAPAAPKTP